VIKTFLYSIESKYFRWDYWYQSVFVKASRKNNKLIFHVPDGAPADNSYLLDSPGIRDLPGRKPE
jgi:hypothetical protein